ncbi:FRG domain-containing protein [Paenibacillus polymyxa]|uniref:FRG domain-containing protein n=1 Tax=Paenibacillus polymyxa TaxID=1406 RepID=UPI0023F958FB|nr:FRG domain-containing protein [Paenibacillus polymyxa]
MIAYEQVVETVHINSAKEIFDAFSPFGSYGHLLNKGFIFRGEATTKYILLPTALRPDNKLWDLVDFKVTEIEGENLEYYQRVAEYKILHKFYVKADRNGMKIPNVDSLRRNMMMFFGEELQLVYNEWLPFPLYELAALAQHYGLPTRLLDWSMDPFVSLYFASVNAVKHGLDMEDHLVLWVLNREFIERMNISIRQVPLTIINPPYGGNENLRAQHGILSLWTGVKFGEDEGEKGKSLKVDRTPLDTLLYKCLSNNTQYKGKPTVVLHKFLIPNNEAKNLLSALDKLNYNAASLFPGFDGVSRSIIENSLIHSN